MQLKNYLYLKYLNNKGNNIEIIKEIQHQLISKVFVHKRKNICTRNYYFSVVILAIQQIETVHGHISSYYVKKYESSHHLSVTFFCVR